MREFNTRLLAGSLVAMMGLLSTGGTLLQAAPVQLTPNIPLVYDLTNVATDSAPGTAGNVQTVTEGTLNTQVDITTWATIGSAGLAASIGHVMTNGLGACNSTEKAFATCIDKAQTRAINSSGADIDWIFIVFEERMQIDSFTVFPDGNQNVDLTYYTGMLNDASLDLTGQTDADLLASGLRRVDVDPGGKRTTPFTVNLPDYATTPGDPVYGNVILIGADGNSRFFLNELRTTTVPIPAAAWLFLSALAVVTARRTRKARD